MTNTNPLVSIIIPAYNADAFVKDAIESCCNQSYRPIEIIVVDDGSTDNTWNIINELKLSDLVLIHQDNKGLSAARNKGISVSKGYYIKFLDADDLMLDGLKNQVKHALSLSENEISVSLYKKRDQILKFENWFSMYTAWLPLFPRDALTRIGGFENGVKYVEDMELTFNIQVAGYRFVPCDCVTYDYRFSINPGSLFLTSRSDIDSIYKFYKKHQRDHIKVTSTKEYNRYFINLLFLVPDLSKAQILYKRFRKDMPFRVNPATINNSRLLGYIVWYGSFILPYNKMMSWIR